MKTPNEVKELYLECTCYDIRYRKWESLMKNHTRADYRKINKLVKIHLPDLFYNLGLDLCPNTFYHYHKTKTHLILVHSGIEYFLKFY